MEVEMWIRAGESGERSMGFYSEKLLWLQIFSDVDIVSKSFDFDGHPYLFEPEFTD